jgi:hypothetical protein
MHDLAVHVKNIFIPNSLSGNEEHILSPIIFSRKTASCKIDSNSSGKILLFETMLLAVTKCYYKSSYDVDSFLKEISAGFRDEPSNQQAEKDRTNKRNRKHKISKARKKPNANQSIEPNDSADEADDRLSLDGELLTDESHLLDYLVSPIKHDFEFGWLKRNMVDQRHGNI